MTSSSSGDVQVLSLAKIIYETAGKIVQQYNSTGHSVPSLDSTDVGPFDAPGSIPADLARDVNVIEGACAQLSMTLCRPSHIVTGKAYGFMEVTCLKVVIDAKIADHLLDAPDGIHISALAARSGLDPEKLGRVLRLLASMHCFREVKPDIFANNRISLQLCFRNPISSTAGFLADEGFTAGCYLSETISNPDFALSSSPDHTAFMKAFGSRLFDFYALPANVERHDRFAKAMIGFSESTLGKHLVAQAIPWESAPEGATLCDFAGGNGHVALDLAKQFPNLHVVVQDLPSVIEQAKQYWNQKFPEAIQNERVQFVEFDFFQESPVPNCKWYFIRYILHDWPDDECVKILSNIRKAMSPDSRLLINEFVIQHVTRENETADQAPEPVGCIRPYQQDILMMMLLNAKERKLQEYVSLAAKAGFKYERALDCGEGKILEFSAV